MEVSKFSETGEYISLKMPPKEVSKLSALCLKNVAANMMRHGVNFSEIHPGCEIYQLYKTAQFLFSDQILKELRHIYMSEVSNMPLGISYCYAKEIKSTDYLGLLTAFLFRGRINHELPFLWPCLKFLFNEYTKEVSLQILQTFDFVEDVPEIFLEALSLCKNLQCLTLQLCRFSEERMLRLFPWSKLVKLDLLLSCCSDVIILHAFKNCPSLQILKATGGDISDQALFCLCKEWGGTSSETFQFCRAGGMCCHLGKKLQKLVLYGTAVTQCGIICALQHLLSMEEFLEGPLTENDPDRHFVAHSINTFKMAHKLHQRPFPILKLTTMIYDKCVTQDLLSEIRECCPFIDTEVFCQSYDVSYLQCHRTSGLALTDTPYVDLAVSFSSIISLFMRQPMKSFSVLGYILFCIYDDENVPYLLEPPPYVQHLEHISLVDVACVGFSFGYFFTKLLSAAVNVKSLTLQGTSAEICFVDAMKVNEFASLEKVSFYNANLDEISFVDLIRRRTVLKEITYFSCKNAEKFVTRHRMFAQKNNFHLDICVGERSICKNTLIKFNLI